MLNSKSTIVRVVSYLVTGFFVLIIVISFGMPDFISRLGLDQSVVAVVNGEPVSRYDFLRFRDRHFSDLRGDAKMDAIILNYYLNDVLSLQEARKCGFTVSDGEVKRTILQIPGIRNETTGEVDLERLDTILQQSNMSFSDLQKSIRHDILRQKFMQFIRMGIGIPADEARAERAAEGSRFQIRYSFLSTMDLQERLKNRITVSEEDISAELNKNKKEMRDPKTDRERIRKKIEGERIASAKKDIVSRINELAMKEGRFDEAQAILGGKAGTSNIFKAGEPLRDERGQPLGSIANSQIFLDDFTTLKPGATSRVISTEAGLYIYTPLVREIPKDEPSASDRAAMLAKLTDESFQAATGNIMQKAFENAKIIKNLKTD